MKLRTALAATGLAVAALVATSAPANAEQVDYTWTWKTSHSHDNIGWARYNTQTNKLEVDDREQDGHSFYVYFDGTYDNYACWDTGGAVGPGVYCSNVWGLGTTDVYLCIGEWKGKKEIDCAYKQTIDV